MSISKKINLIWPRAAAVLLWLVSGVSGIVAIYSVFQLSLLAFALATSQSRDSIGRYFTGVFAGQITVMLAGLAWLAVSIWSAEYAIKHVGEPRLWKMFAWVIGIELFLILLAWFFNLL